MTFATRGRPPNAKRRTLAELMDVSQGVFGRGECALLEKQVESHRRAATASGLPRVRAHLIHLANELDAVLAGQRRRAAEKQALYEGTRSL